MSIEKLNSLGRGKRTLQQKHCDRALFRLEKAETGERAPRQQISFL